MAKSLYSTIKQRVMVTHPVHS